MATNSTHAPRPWRVSVVHEEWLRDLPVRTVYVFGSEPELTAVAKIEWVGADATYECLANARLIAAAPDLLEAAKVLRSAHRLYMKNSGSVTFGRLVAVAADQLDAAIAAAEA